MGELSNYVIESLKEHFLYNTNATVTIEDANGYKITGELISLNFPLSADIDLDPTVEFRVTSFETPVAKGKVININGTK